jgi:type II secretory pathway predicted ATPase ExeA
MSTPIYKELQKFIRGTGRIAVVKAPPGSGKSYNLLEALDGALADGKRIAIAAQTNNQVDDSVPASPKKELFASPARHTNARVICQTTCRSSSRKISCQMVHQSSLALSQS